VEEVLMFNIRRFFGNRLRRRYGRSQLSLPFGGMVTDVLGEARPKGKVWPDGAYNCPFCGSAAEASGCKNPACSAGEWALSHPEQTRPRYEAAKRQAEERKAEEASREENRKWQERYHEERRQEEATRINAIEHEARTKGTCVRCAIESSKYGRKTKFTKHRGQCPLEKR
jgi:hypothetical protein